MTAAAEMTTELTKLNKSQRTAMRRIVSSALTELAVDRRGWNTVVRAVSCGFVYLVTLGPRGMVLDKRIWERRECA